MEGASAPPGCLSLIPDTGYLVGARLVAGAMAAHVGTAEATVHTDSSRAMQLQSSGCRVLTSLALTGDAGRDAGGLLVLQVMHVASVNDHVG